MSDQGTNVGRVRRRPKLTRERRREQILGSAERLLSRTGLRSTTTAALAKTAGVSEAMLYQHFRGKEELFEAVLERNTRRRLASLEDRFASIPELPPLECVACMAETTILACADEEIGIAVMAWALMEIPEFAADIYRQEIGATEALWDSEIFQRFGGSPARTKLTIHLVPYVVHACMSFGFWLAALRHKTPTAKAHARQYAEGVVDATRMALSLREEAPGTIATGASHDFGIGRAS